MLRTHQCGHLQSANAGSQVVLAGWVARRRDHGGIAFLDLRDASGIVQVVINDEKVAHDLRSEYCLQVRGEVRNRPEGNENPDIATGYIEVVANDVVVLSASAPLPFPIDDAVNVGEENLRGPRSRAASQAANAPN